MLSAPRRLRCEYLANPLGIALARPRLSWWPSDMRPAEIQSSYQIQAADSREALLAGAANLWDSGQRDDSTSANITYDGPSLTPATRVWWRVRTYDSDGLPSPWSDAAFFETGLDAESWQARWITASSVGPQVVALRRGFKVQGPVHAARLYITALGLYQAELNGQRVGLAELTPGWTDYQQRVNYQVFDVTAQIRSGRNALGVLLADGWYAGGVGLAGQRCYGHRPRLFAQLCVEGPEGRTVAATTDADWLWRPSPIFASDLLQGEHVDARRRVDGWSTATREPEIGAWQPIVVVEPPTIDLSSTLAPPVRVIRELNACDTPVSLPDTAGQRLVYDFGQNLVGRVQLRVRAARGTVFTLRHAERCSADGSLYRANLRSAAATDSYIAAGDDDGETFEPVFTVHGFQFVEISGVFPASAVLGVKARVLACDMPQSGSFECDEPLLNRLQQNIVWSQRGNQLSIPTDCPQRDERLGWTGPAQAFARTAAFNLDSAAFTAKWLQDLADAQLADGSVPPIAPLPPTLKRYATDGGAGWSDALIISTWVQYRCYHDRRALARHYAACRRFVESLAVRFPDGIRDTDACLFGDWLAPNHSPYGDARRGTTPSALLGTAFYYHSARLLARMAGVLGNLPDLERYDALANDVRGAFRNRFVTPDGLLAGTTQTALVLALHFGLLENREHKFALDTLVADIRARDTHLATGVLGTPYLLHVLTAGGELAIAYDLLLQRSAPGWLYPVTVGATTIWERWDGFTEKAGYADPGMNSFNQPAFGSVGEWLYQTVAGLDLHPDLAASTNAYRHALIEPQPPIGKGFSGSPPLRSAQATLDTVHGRFVSGWRLDAEALVAKVRVPVNCSATLVLPDGQTHALHAGAFECRMPLGDDVGVPLLQSRVS